MIISTAANRAADGLAAHIPIGRKTFIDSTNFDQPEDKYAIAAVRSALLKHGILLVDDRKTADMVVEIRAGSLSMDQSDFLVGIPSIPLPFPTGTISTPELAFFKEQKKKGTVKFGAVSCDPHTGAYIYSVAPNLGISKEYGHTVLFFFSWTSDDLLPSNPPIPEDPPHDIAAAAKAPDSGVKTSV